MQRAKQALLFARSVLLLAIVAACADQPVTPDMQSNDASFSAASAGGRSPRDVPEVRIDLPPTARPWDTDPAALSQAVFAGGGYAVVTFKEPGSARALATGRRAAVTAGTVRAGLQLLERNGVEVLELLDGIGGARVRIDPTVAAEISRHPLVDFVEPRQYVYAQAQTTPWGITMVGAPTFWSNQGTSGAGAKVLIIDTGHQQNHPDLPAVPTANCAGAYGGCNDASSASWHGTHVLGIVAARNNTIGVVGVAPGITAADVYMYGACNDSGGCPTDEVSTGISAGIWNVHVMNLSLGGPTYDAGMATAVAQAWSNGIVIVAAAGNNGGNTINYPAAHTNVVGVSGVVSTKAFAGPGVAACGHSSNYGSHVDLAAPFEAYSTIGGSSYGTLCGTSMATPHVTGVAALIKAKYPTWTNQQIVTHLFNTAEDRGTAGRDNYYGFGIVRALPVPPPCPNITGPTSISTSGSYTWQANAACGNGTYTYQWQYRTQGSTTWTNVGTGSSYTRSVSASDLDFEVRVNVTSGGVTGSDTHLVDVGPCALCVTITGRAVVVAAGNYTWNASVTGGNGTNTYQWQYRDLGTTTWYNAGTGSSYGRYVGQGDSSFELQVTVTSNGLTASDTHAVNVSIEPMCGEFVC